MLPGNLNGCGCGLVCLQAEKVFGELRYLDPHYMEGMEIYSTTLWHLQRDVALSALAQELTEMDLNSPQV